MKTTPKTEPDSQEPKTDTPTIHALEVEKSRLERSRGKVIARMQETITGYNTKINKVTEDIILLKEKELADLKIALL